jgi:SPW repeat-containing protein
MTRSQHDPSPLLAAALVTAGAVAPWALGFSASHAAVAGAIAFAMAFGPIAMLVSALPAAALTTSAAGVWLAASPWALGYASSGAATWAVDLLAGVALTALGWRAWRTAARGGAAIRRAAAAHNAGAARAASAQGEAAASGATAPPAA